MKILEEGKVSPANSPAHFSLPLTFFDISWLSLDPTSRLFFYEFPEQNIDFSNTFLPKLKNSLSLALYHYLPLAGNLTWPKDSDKPVVVYQTGDGVSLTIAETLADFYSLSRDDFRESIGLRHLLPDYPSSETSTPVMTIKITIFPNVGFSVAYVAHHAVLDGRSVSLFLHSWAYICGNSDGSVLPSDLTPFLDRSFVEQQSDLERVYPKSFFGRSLEKKELTKYDTTPPIDSVLGTFKLTREHISNLRKSIFAYKNETNKLQNVDRVSSFTIASAYAMVCLVKTMEIQAEKTFIGINVDARSRLDPPLPSTYLGNCVIGVGSGCDTKDLLSDDGFFVAVENVSDALASLNDGIVKVVEKTESLVYNIFRDFAGFFIAGSPRFELYKVDFGCGKPTKIDMVSIAKTGAFSLSDHRKNDGGIEIGIALRKHQAESFSTFFSGGLLAC